MTLSKKAIAGILACCCIGWGTPAHASTTSSLKRQVKILQQQVAQLQVRVQDQQDTLLATGGLLEQTRQCIHWLPVTNIGMSLQLWTAGESTPFITMAVLGPGCSLETP